MNAINSNDLHVMPLNEKNWAVIFEGHSDPDNICEFKAEALGEARKKAIRLNSVVVVHGLSGEVEYKQSYIV